MWNFIEWIVVSKIWIPIVATQYVIYNWLSWHNNQEGSSKGWAIAMFIMGFMQSWLFVSRYTKNILFDGMIYDIVLFLSFPLTMWYLGETAKFGTRHWVGLILMIVGVSILKIDFLKFFQKTS